MFSPNRLLTPKEQALLFGVVVTVLIGTAALIWQARRAPATVEMADGAAKPSKVEAASPVPVKTEPGSAKVSAPPAAPSSTPAPATPSGTADLPPAEPPKVAAAVRGGVRREGLFRLDADSRVADLIMSAGGATEEADLSGINLAARLVDGTTLTVPVRGRITEQNGVISGHGAESAATGNPAAYLAGSAPVGDLTQGAVSTTGTTAQGAVAAPAQATAGPGKGSAGGPINLNTATKQELELLPGIGPVLAGNIITYRESKPFQNVEELDNVPGIGAKRLEAVRGLVAAP